jgi:hypothetical protein
MADDDPKPGQPQPSPGLPEAVKARIKEMAGLGLGVSGGAHFGGESSGQFSPSHGPSNASGGDQPGGVARGRHLGEPTPGERDAKPAVPSVAEILRDPKRYLPPTPPVHGHGRGPKR